MTRFPAVAAAVFAAMAAGCGYHAGAHADLMPKSVHTIAIPAFQNVTVRYQLARLLPAEIGREFLSRTSYAIVADPSQADAVLNGALANFATYVVNAAEGRATAAQVVVTLNLELVERRTGKVLFSRKGAEFRERYEIALKPSDYFDESGSAMVRVSRDVAATVVSAVLEAF